MLYADLRHDGDGGLTLTVREDRGGHSHIVYAHYYDDPVHAAADVLALSRTMDTSDWDGNDPDAGIAIDAPGGTELIAWIDEHTLTVYLRVSGYAADKFRATLLGIGDRY